MKYVERIDLVCEAEDQAAILEAVRNEGFDVEPIQKTVVRQMIEHDRYSPDARNRLKAAVDALELPLRLFSGGVHPEFDDADYEQADGVVVILPKISCKRVPSWRTRCAECKKTVVSIDYTFQLPRLATRRAIGDLEGWYPVISQSLIDEAGKRGLTGLEAKPLTRSGDFHWLDTRTRFSERYLPEDEVLDFRGHCPACGNYVWDNAFGPYRFQRDQWPAEDFMLYVVGFPRLLCSKRAYEFLLEVEPDAERVNLVFVQ